MANDLLMGKVRDFLKQSTADAHRKLDASPLVAGLSNGSLEDDAYLAMLQAYLQFFSPWETTVRELHPDIIAEIGDYRFEKNQWLTEDIATLGGTPEIPAPIHPPTDRAGLIGSLYVVEGSTLGGMHLHRSQRGPIAKAGRFFKGYGEETVPAWKTFVEWLELQPLSEPEMHRAAETAKGTFAWFQSKFDDTSRALALILPGGRD